MLIFSNQFKLNYNVFVISNVRNTIKIKIKHLECKAADRYSNKVFITKVINTILPYLLSSSKKLCFAIRLMCVSLMLQKP